MESLPSAEIENERDAINAAESQLKQGRNASLAATGILMFIGMFCYETLKEILFPDSAVWQSHLMTICFGSEVAIQSAKVVLRKMKRLPGVFSG